MIESPSSLPASNLTAVIKITFADGVNEINTVFSTNSSLGPTKPTTAFIQGAVFSKMLNGTGTFKISIIDPTWFNVEKAIRNNRGVCKISYGYLSPKMTGPESSDSSLTPPSEALIFDYDLDYNIGQLTVNMSGLLLGYGSALDSTWKLNPSVFKSPNVVDNIINDIVDRYGFGKGLIEPTDSTKAFDYTDLFSTDKRALKIPNSSSQTTLQYVLEKVVNSSVNINNKGAYHYFLTAKNPRTGLTDAKTPIFLNFCTNDYILNNSKTFVKHYKIYAEKQDVRIVDYKPNWSINKVGILGGFGITNTQFDRVSGDKVGASGFGVFSPDDPSRAKYIRSASFTGQSAATATQVAQDKVNLQPLEAQLVVLGDPTFEIADIVRVDTRIPTGPQKNMTHQMSGLYLVKQISDKIQMGSFLTSLDLMIAAPFAVVKDYEKKIAI